MKNIILYISLGIVIGGFGSTYFLGYLLYNNIPTKIETSLLASIPGTLVGLLALFWNVHNQTKINSLSEIRERKNYTLDWFDKYAAEPVTRALNTLDGLKKEIDECLDSGKAYDLIKKDLEDIMENKVSRYIIDAYFICKEADLYLSAGGHPATLSRTMHESDEENKLDDIIIEKLNNACQQTSKNNVFNKNMGDVKLAIVQKKAKMRNELTKIAGIISNSFKL